MLGCSEDLCLFWQRPREQLCQHLPGKQRAPVAPAGSEGSHSPLRAPAKGPQRGVAASKASLSLPCRWTESLNRRAGRDLLPPGSWPGVT